MINVKSLKFNADEKLLDFIEKKVGKVEKFFDNMGDIDVTLSLLPDAENKSSRRTSPGKTSSSSATPTPSRKPSRMPQTP